METYYYMGIILLFWAPRVEGGGLLAQENNTVACFFVGFDLNKREKNVTTIPNMLV